MTQTEGVIVRLLTILIAISHRIATEENILPRAKVVKGMRIILCGATIGTAARDLSPGR